ncbi:DUF2927 domain-containing protein [Tenacibaculum sp.]|uniref:DUF2927 domain-containing protein n=1 Tax=Tenacibaculum sp. TaxID=1906242 RepID=UPI003D13E733
MKKKSIILLIIILIVFSTWVYKSEEKYIPTDYEISVINYFNEIAIKSEYFDNPERVTKWRKPMNLFIYKEAELSKQMELIYSTIKTINSIASDGFKIEIIEDYKDASAVLYLCDKNKVKELAPNFYKLIEDSVNYEYTGFSYIEFKLTNFVINKALIFVDTEVSINEQKHSIVEELTQSLGLSNDSNKYSDSIFYESDSIQEKTGFSYSKMDIALIKYLYAPKMKPGFKEKSAEIVIKKIMKSEKNLE